MSKPLHFILYLCVVGSTAFAPAAATAATTEPGDPVPVCRPESLPADIRASLERRFAGWKIQEQADLSPRALDRWTHRQPHECPGIAAGRFGSSPDTFYALLVISPERSSLRVLMFTQESSGQFYSFRVVERQDGAVADFYLRTVVTDTYEGKEINWGFRTARPKQALMLMDAGATDALMYVQADGDYQKRAIFPCPLGEPSCVESGAPAVSRTAQSWGPATGRTQ